VALKAREWNKKDNIGLVTGATYPGELKRVRELCPEMPLLIPGIGAQGGDLVASVKAGLDAQGGRIIVNSSREVLYASKGKDFAQASRKVAERLRSEIQQAAKR
jgi:orotidine-5'-phosphate decarboxylase